MLRNWKKKLKRYRYTCKSRYLLGLLILLQSGQSLCLPDIPSFMDCEDIIFNSGFQDDSNPTNGSGGILGAQTRSVFSNGQNRNYHIYVPSSYTDNNPLPLMILYHGAGGAGTSPSQAIAMRNFWQTAAENNNYIIMAQESTGASGGWVPGTDFPILSDLLGDMYLDYNIEQTRIYGYGFSAGAHVMHTLMLFNSLEFAAYIVSAGVLEAHAGVNAPGNSARIIPVYVSIGINDASLIPFVQSNHIVFNNAGWIDDETYWLDEFNGGHQVDIQIQQKSWDKVCTFSNLQ